MASVCAASFGAISPSIFCSVGIGVRGGEIREDGVHAPELLSRSLQRDDGVFEGRLGRILRDRVDSFNSSAIPASKAGGMLAA